MNDWRIGAYHRSEIENYNMGDTLEFGDNKSYYLFTQNGYTISVQSAKKYSLEEFCDSYDITANDFLHAYDTYIELTAVIENKGDPSTKLQLLGLVLRGADWKSFYDEFATTFANDADPSMGNVYNLQLPVSNPVCIKIVYGLQRGNFPLSRWNNIEKEDMWLITTIMPIEKRIRISI